MQILRIRFFMFLLVFGFTQGMQHEFTKQLVKDYKNMKEEEHNQPGSYPVMLAKMYNEYLEQNKLCCFTPFSGMGGRQLIKHVIKPEGTGWGRTPGVYKYETPEHTDFYDLLKFSKEFYDGQAYADYEEQVLEPLKLTPKDIVKRCEQGGKTIIVELIESGRSIGTFVSLLIGAGLREDYEFDDMLSAFGVHGYMWELYKNSSREIKMDKLPFVHQEKIKFGSKKENFMQMLASGETLSDYDNGRLVPEFKQESWNDYSVLSDFKLNKKVPAQLLHTLHCAVNKYHNN